MPAMTRPDTPGLARRAGCGLRPWCCWMALAALQPALAVQPGADLTALSLESLMQLTVVGASKYAQKQSEVAAAVNLITRREIQAFGWRTLAEALASLPGIHTSYDRQYTYVGMRGLGLPGDLTARLLITLNGNRVNDPVYDAGPAGRELPIDLDLVDRIEFIPGPGGAVYGHNAMFGVINIVTRSGSDLAGGELALTSQPAQRQHEARASWGRRLGQGTDLLLSVSSLRARGADRFYGYGATGVSGVAAGLDGERVDQFVAQAVHGAWSADLVQGARRKDDPTAAFFTDPLVAGQFNSDAYTLAQVQYQGPLAGEDLQLSARLFAGRYRYEGQFRYQGDWSTQPSEGDWRGTEWRLLYTGWAAHKLMLGLEAQQNRRTDQAVLDRANPANDLRIAGSGYRVGLYLQNEWQLSPSLGATLGMRVDRNGAIGSSASPRAALIWQAAAGTTFKALYGRAHRAPNAYERDYDDGHAQVANPTLKGERIDTLEWVADHQVGSDLNLRGTLYRWTMQDIIVLGLDSASGLPQYQSGPTVQARGLQLSADQTWAAGARLRASLSLQDLGYAGAGRLPNAPRLLAKLNLSTPLPWAGLRAGYELHCDSPRLSLDGVRLGGYALSHLHLSTDALAPGLTLSLHFANLFDKRHAHPGAESNWQNALDQDGRSARARLSYRF